MVDKNTPCKYAYLGCVRTARCKEMCNSCYAKIKKGQQPMSGRIRRHGTKSKRKDGYVGVYYPNHPMSSKNGYVMEHRYVVSESLGRPLLSTEHVHHKNGDRSDNRLENLELWNSSQPYGQRVQDKIQFALEILNTYAPELLADKEKNDKSILPFNQG